MKGIIIAFASFALVSFYPIFGKLLLEEVSPFVIILLSQALAAIVLIIALSLIKKIKNLMATSKHDMMIIYIITILGGVIAPLLFLFGLNLTTATNSILIAKTEFLFTTLIAIFFLNEKITRPQMLGSLIIVGGILLISTDNFANGLSFNIGDLMIIFAAFIWSVATIVFKKYMGHIDPEIIITLRNLFGAIVLFLLSLFIVDLGGLAGALSTEFMLAMLGLVILTIISAQYLWYKALELTTVTNVSFASLSTPIFTIIYAYFFLNERLLESQIYGGLLVLLGLFVLEFHFKRHPKERQLRRLKVRNWPHM